MAEAKTHLVSAIIVKWKKKTVGQVSTAHYDDHEPFHGVFGVRDEDLKATILTKWMLKKIDKKELDGALKQALDDGLVTVVDHKVIKLNPPAVD